MINATFAKLGMAWSKELIMVFIPSFFDIIRRGRRALRARKPLKKEKFIVVRESSIQFMIDVDTMMKSRMLHESFKYVPSPK